MDNLHILEQDKYDRMHQVPGYSEGPGLSYVVKALNYIPSGASIIDFGCGTGDAACKFASLGHDVQLVDISIHGLTKFYGLKDKFFQASLHELPDELRPAEWGFCTDVMEHLPQEWVRPALRQISGKVKNCFFTISGHPDGWGKHIGQKLHLTVAPAEWWIGMIMKHFLMVERINTSSSIYEIVARGAYVGN
jgi:2-polyprenyl-3-methyl-5-hydroxy-6-metoxy-1,4-benzoquinol methylase